MQPSPHWGRTTKQVLNSAFCFALFLRKCDPSMIILSSQWSYLWIFVVNLHLLPMMICMLSAWLSRFLFVKERNSPDQQQKKKKKNKKNWTWLNYSIQQLQKTLLWTCEVLICPDKLRYTFKQIRFWSNWLITLIQTKANLCHKVVWFIIFSFV